MFTFILGNTYLIKRQNKFPDYVKCILRFFIITDGNMFMNFPINTFWPILNTFNLTMKAKINTLLNENMQLVLPLKYQDKCISKNHIGDLFSNG